MKNLYLLIIASTITLTSTAQWSVLYEGGLSTTDSILSDWGSGTSATTDGDSAMSIVAFSSPDYTASFLYYSYDLVDEHVFLVKDFPEMADYASLRFYVDMTLPDSIGTISFYTLANDMTWELFSTDEPSQNVPFLNPNGHTMVKLEVNLLLTDSVNFSFDYIRIEFDSTAMLGTNEQAGLRNLQLFSNGAALTVNPHNSETYSFSVTDLTGKEVFNTAAEGKSVTVLSELHGIFLVCVSQNGTTVQKRIWLE